MIIYVASIFILIIIIVLWWWLHMMVIVSIKVIYRDYDCDNDYCENYNDDVASPQPQN